MATPAAREAIASLRVSRGPLMFVQSAGCCEGSAPMCFDAGELIVGDHDVLLGEVEGCPVYIDERLEPLWQGTTLVLDVSAGEPEGFSLSAGDGSHFVARAVRPSS